MRFRFLALVLATIAALAPGARAQAPSAPPPALFPWFLPRISYRVEPTDAVGRQGGLSTLDLFLPLADSPDRDALIFRDFRLLYQHETGWFAGNVGGGYRRYLPDLDVTLGGYGYYDYQRPHGNSMHQAVAGVECFGNIVDARANVYVPFGDKRQSLGSTFTANTDAVFQGNNLLVNGGTTRQFFEQALTGFDAETGVRLYAGSGVEVRLVRGRLLLHGPRVGGDPRAAAAARRPALRLRDDGGHLPARPRLQEHPLGRPDGLVPAALRPAAVRRAGRALAPNDRLGDPVLRAGSIAIQRQTKTTTTPREAAIDPLTGQPLFFLHVAPGAGGNGTFESPYAALTQAVADPRFKAGNLVVYDRGQDVFTGNVTLSPGTRLLSAGPLQQILTTNAGLVTLPFSGSGTSPSAAHHQRHGDPGQRHQAVGLQRQPAGGQRRRHRPGGPVRPQRPGGQQRHHRGRPRRRPRRRRRHRRGARKQHQRPDGLRGQRGRADLDVGQPGPVQQPHHLAGPERHRGARQHPGRHELHRDGERGGQRHHRCGQQRHRPAKRRLQLAHGDARRQRRERVGRLGPGGCCRPTGPTPRR